MSNNPSLRRFVEVFQFARFIKTRLYNLLASASPQRSGSTFSGFSMVELLVVVSLFSIVIAGTTSMMGYQMKKSQQMNFQRFILRLCVTVVTLLSLACHQGKKMNEIDYSTFYSNPTEIELIKAIMRGDSPTVKRLSASGVNLNAIGKYENTPLRVALMYQQKEIVALLLQLGVDPNFITPKITAPAFVALKFDDPDYLNMLLMHGLSPNLKEDNDPLVFAAIREGQWTHFKTLMNKGADIHSKSRDNTSLVLELVGVSQYDLAKSLILHGADYTTPNNTGLTVLKVLVNDQTVLCENPNHPACQKRAELLKMLRERGIDVPKGLPAMNDN